LSAPQDFVSFAQAGEGGGFGVGFAASTRGRSRTWPNMAVNKVERDIIMFVLLLNKAIQVCV
jgi:hypothetical protein